MSVLEMMGTVAGFEAEEGGDLIVISRHKAVCGCSMEKRPRGYEDGRKTKEETTAIVQVSVGDEDQCGGLGGSRSIWISDQFFQ